MKILAVNIHYSPLSLGGATVVCEAINESFLRRGDVELLVVRLESDPRLPEYFFRKYYSLGSPVIAINKHFNYNKEFFDEILFNMFMQVEDSFRPDIIHLHSIQHFGFLNSWPHDLLYKKAVITLHDAWWICDRQFLLKHNGKTCNEDLINDVACKTCSSMPDNLGLKRRARIEVLSSAKKIYVPSDYLCKKYENFTGLKDRFEKLPNPIGEAIGYKRRKTSKQEIVFGFLGGPGITKGFDQLLEAFKKSYAGHIKLLLVDVGKRLGFPWYGREISKVPGVKIMGPFFYPQRYKFYNNIDVLLCPSLVGESYGLAVREAFQYGKWVICTNVGGLSEDCSIENSVVLDPDLNLVEQLQDCFESASKFRKSPSNFPRTIDADDYTSKLLTDFYCG